jgi:phage tail sheath protein FI
MCAFLVSPGVSVVEIDATNVVPAVSTAIGGYVGTFEWGPAEQAILVSSEKQLSTLFGVPSDLTAKSFHIAASFLKYGNSLKVSRAVAYTTSPVASYSFNATSTAATGLLIKNQEAFSVVDSTAFSFIARYPGTFGNNIRVQVASGTTFASASASFKANFDYTPSYTLNAAYSDEIHVLITNELTGEVLEKYVGLSMAPDAKKADGTTLYYKNVLNASSSYIYANDLGSSFANDKLLIRNASTQVFNTPAATTSDTVKSVLLSGGVTSADDHVQYSTAADVFTDPDVIDVSLLFGEETGVGSKSTLETQLETIAVNRKDCITFVSAPATIATQSSSANKLSLATAKAGLFNTSYVVVDSTPVYTYNKYNDTYLWIPACGHIAGLCARTDNTNDPWWSPAGYNRGVLLGVTKLAFNPTQAERDELYKVGANPIVSFPGQGIMLYGDKTSQKKPSAFDRINVRRLFIVLEKAIATAAKYQLFEFNDEFTRAMFRNMVEPFLRDVKGRRGIYDFMVVCDETNNTGEVIDTNRFVGDIYIKPARSINFINLNFVAVRTGVAFSEIAGK